ncbi:MAG: hypothetical protein H6873_02360 [Hyphomicrobiaceae bacterium]|nr:hypothetical protein [Hyphomicrobiaceae bacterium]
MSVAGSGSGLARATGLEAHLGDAQWFYHRARQSVYFTAFSPAVPNRAELQLAAKALCAHAPQLLDGFESVFGNSAERFDPLIEMYEVPDLSAYPDAWDVTGAELFDRPDLPPFRIRVAISVSGPDQEGRAASILVLATHALLEGADSARLSRSGVRNQTKAGGDIQKPTPKGLAMTAALLAPVQLLLGNLLGPKKGPRGQRSLVLDHGRVRDLAHNIGVSQRAFLFALVGFALNGEDHIFSRKRIFINFTTLGVHGEKGHAGDFQFHVMEARLPLKPDFATFARCADESLAKADARGPTFSQAFINRLFALHRRLAERLPVLYPTRFFQFAGFFDLNLSITPPHRLAGPLTRSLMEPIFAGTFHPGLNSCVFVPQKKVITLNFEMQSHLLDRVGAVQHLFESL